MNTTPIGFPKYYRRGDQLVIDHGAPHREHPGGIEWGRLEVQQPFVVTNKWRRKLAKLPAYPEMEQAHIADLVGARQ